jgi:hypothetical protein
MADIVTDGRGGHSRAQLWARHAGCVFGNGVALRWQWRRRSCVRGVLIVHVRRARAYPEIGAPSRQGAKRRSSETPTSHCSRMAEGRRYDLKLGLRGPV